MTAAGAGDGTRGAGGLLVVAGSLFVAAGAGAWAAVTAQLRAEKITVPPNARLVPGARVQGPVSAFAEADVIKGNAERGAGGRTFADISEALRGVDGKSEEAAELRKHSLSLSTAAALRTALMTSVLAYGVSALVVGLGGVFVIAGALLRRRA